MGYETACCIVVVTCSKLTTKKNTHTWRTHEPQRYFRDVKYTSPLSCAFPLRVSMIGFLFFRKPSKPTENSQNNSRFGSPIIWKRLAVQKRLRYIEVLLLFFLTRINVRIYDTSLGTFWKLTVSAGFEHHWQSFHLSLVTLHSMYYASRRIGSFDRFVRIVWQKPPKSDKTQQCPGTMLISQTQQSKISAFFGRN